MDSTNETPMLITREEAARLLTISERKLWELTNARQVPCVRIGRAVRFVARDLREWVEDQKEWPDSQ
ncbi:MAG: helix-turn-helix domain-containing protein [Pirellulaceae bacterium]|jgi:excisionase family DNA binding protein|nr:helix-turn-helix domain-containing protein [Pirellulaceae bacterium]MDP6717188.1 helix-turn-helix domain-containing protein [Pirellulaceae bacterium]